MRTATCALVADTSKFDGPIDQAKAKLASLGEMIKKLVAAILAVVTAIKIFSEFKNKIELVAKSVQYLNKVFSDNGNIAKTIFSDIKNVVKENVESLISNFKSLREASQKAFDSIKSGGSSVPPILKKTSGGFADVISQAKYFTAAALLMTATFKIVGGVFSLTIGIISKLFSGLVSIFTTLASLVKSVVVSAFNILTATLKGLAVGAVAVGTAIAAMTAVVSRGVLGVFEMGDQLKRFKDITGASIPFLMFLQKAFKQSGMSADDVIPVLSEMNRSISQIDEKGNPSNKSLAQMGQNLQDLQKLSAGERFIKLGLAIGAIGDKGLQAQYALDIFGKNGRKLLAVFSDPSALANFGKSLDASSRTMEQESGRFARISAKLKDSGNLFRGFFIQIAGGIAPQLETIIDMISKGDMFTPLGEAIGKKLSYGLDVFVGAIQQGRILEALKNALIIPVIFFTSYAKRSFSALQEAVSTIMSPRRLTVLFTDIPAKSMLGSLGSALLELFKSVAQLFAVVFLDAMQTPLAAIQIAFERLAISFGKSLGQSILDFALPQLNKIAKLLGFEGLSSAIGEAMKTAGFETKMPTFGEAVRQRTEKNRREGFLDFGQGTLGDAVGNVTDKAKAVFVEISDMTKVLVSSFKNMEGMSDADKAKVEKAFSVLADLQKAGAELVKQTPAVPFAEAFTPQTEGDTRIRSATQDAVSSLQRIGGGGGAFGGIDPLLKNAERQTTLQEKMVQELQKQNKGGLQSSLAGGKYTYAVFDN